MRRCVNWTKVAGARNNSNIYPSIRISSQIPIYIRSWHLRSVASHARKGAFAGARSRSRSIQAAENMISASRKHPRPSTHRAYDPGQPPECDDLSLSVKSPNRRERVHSPQSKNGCWPYPTFDTQYIYMYIYYRDSDEIDPIDIATVSLTLISYRRTTRRRSRNLRRRWRECRDGADEHYRQSRCELHYIYICIYRVMIISE